MGRNPSGRFQLLVEPGECRLILFDSLSADTWLSSDISAQAHGDADFPTWTKLALPKELREEPASPEDQDAPQQNLSRMQSMERDAIVQMLNETGGNKLEAAKRLGIGRQTLYNKIEAYGIE